MDGPVIIDKSFSKADIDCHKNEITCYSYGSTEGISLAEYIGYVIDTLKGRRRCSDGKCTLEDVDIVIRIGKPMASAEELNAPSAMPLSPSR